jgi:hypothetical protein
MRRHLTYANVVASLALFLAVGGSALAAGSLINGHSVRKGSLPGNRIAKASVAGNRIAANALTGKQIKEGSLGAVGEAQHAATATGADRATSAGVADSTPEAAHAAVADQLPGGLTGASFVPSRLLRAGIADSTAVPKQTVLTLDDLGVVVETDGNADFDVSVVLRNTGSTSVGFVNVMGVSTVAPGGTFVLDGATDGWTALNEEATVLIQKATPGRAAVLHCYFPGAATVSTWCEASSYN